jgi:P27 family predicted phage terminase small subunit
MTRPAKATHLHVLEGTLNATRHKKRQHEPKPQGDLIEPPDWMDEEHQAVWRGQIRACPAGPLKRIDQKAMETWTCAAVAHTRAAQRFSAEGASGQLVLVSKDKNFYVNPFLSVMNRQAEILKATGAELGFSPASRTKISVEGFGAAKTDPVDMYFDD